MKKIGNVKCPQCGVELPATKHMKFPPHKKGNVRCSGSGKPVTQKQ